jgi:fatty acid desaturase
MKAAAARRPRAWLPRLRHCRDWQSLAYMAACPLLVIRQWQHGFSLVLYALLLGLTLGVGVIHHNHTHLRMWRGSVANRLTDFAITLLQGHPACVFYPTHVANHHRYKHGPEDIARTYRFDGDTNDLWGYLRHPMQAVGVLYPVIFGWLARLHRHWPGVWRYCLLQYATWLALWTVLVAIDPVKALIYVVVPQLHGLHWLLATNYLRHAHADGTKGPAGSTTSLNYARNFEGLVNPLLFNIGLHTAHHEHSRTHWSALTRLHKEHYRHRVHPALNEHGLALYMARVFLLGSLFSRFRSTPLMRAPSSLAMRLARHQM